MNKQDILHGILVLGLAGTAILNKLTTLLSPKSFTIVEVLLAFLLAFVYYADIIFIKKQDLTPPAPQIPST